ncbi:Hypothetical protein PHPALM_14089 [Phytophthora palmivora]|uniref:PiggyBac transposable element-derived protein domain-containing protein n=1 Tax=Phytophthora palmivora TaxID=4796 RepID=A0A2P4XVX1_9STRA|nr:Hypothetical protein PHPALM_14089 [Phytophthora palmivora]
MLATGCKRQYSKNDGSIFTVRCPSIIPEYPRGMGGVDVYDQTRLHQYSIEKTVAMRKYYMQRFLGMVDTAIISGFIIHTFVERQRALPLTQINLDFESNKLCKNLLSQPLSGTSYDDASDGAQSSEK